jgi:serine/threonine-protein kinase
MAVNNNKGGSDLDVFEGLGSKKSATRTSQPPPPGTVPPPPPTLRGMDNGAGMKGTLLGMASPMALPPPAASAGTAASSTSHKGAPLPPPGRGALPAVIPPPSKSPSSLPAAASSSNAIPEALKTRPADVASNSKLDIDWDDEEEATQIFNGKESSKSEAAPKAPLPNSSLPAVSKPVQQKQTLLGMNTPFAPPPPSPNAARSQNPFLVPTPMASPLASTGGAFPRTSSAPAPPPPHPPGLEARPSRAADRPAPMFPPPSVAPPAPLPAPPHQSTRPLAMPPRSLPPSGGVRPSVGPAFRAPPPDVHTSRRPVSRMEETALVRPPDQSRAPLMIGVTLGVVALAAAVFYFMPRSGQIAVNVADSKGSAIPHLEIYVDGKKQCEAAPCIVSDLPAGSHTVKVEASGFEPPADKAVAVESRKDTTIDFALAPMANAGTGIRVTGTQPGTKLFVDDKEIGPLPQDLRDMTPGSHLVKIAGGERYAPAEKTVTISKDELQDLGTQTLKVVKGKATISLGTPGARVFIVSGSDRRELPALPISVDIDTSKQWSLVASKPGYNDYNQPISFDDGQAEKAFTVALDPKTPTPAYGGNAAPAWSPPPPRPSPAAASPPASTEGAAAATGQAFLNINSIPASSIALDGKPIGSTPKLKYPVSPGAHSVVFVNPDQGFKKQISVSVGAGETKAAIGRN